PPSDVFSLGATLYVLLTDRLPFAGSSNAETVARVERGEVVVPRVQNPEVPRPLEAICLKALAVRPDDRYASAQALADEIERWLANEPVTALREPWTARARRWATRHQTLVVSSVAVLIVGGVGLLGLGLMWHRASL